MKDTQHNHNNGHDQLPGHAHPHGADDGHHEHEEEHDHEHPAGPVEYIRLTVLAIVILASLTGWWKNFMERDWQSLAATLIPTRYRDGSGKEYRARLDDPEKGPQIRKAVESALNERDGGKGLMIARYRPNPKWQGKSIKDIAAAENKSPTDLVIEIEKAGGASVVNFGMSEDDVRIYMKEPWVATASDGSSQIPGDTVPHPRSYGTFPRKIGLYAVREKVLPLEQAVRSASGLPADILGLNDRGYLKPGQFADVVVFNPAEIIDAATFDQPFESPKGIPWVFVNGKPAVKNGEPTKSLTGRALRHASKLTP